MRRVNGDSKAVVLGTGRMRFPFSEIGRPQFRFSLFICSSLFLSFIHLTVLGLGWIMWDPSLWHRNSLIPVGGLSGCSMQA